MSAINVTCCQCFGHCSSPTHPSPLLHFDFSLTGNRLVLYPPISLSKSHRPTSFGSVATLYREWSSWRGSTLCIGYIAQHILISHHTNRIWPLATSFLMRIFVARLPTLAWRLMQAMTKQTAARLECEDYRYSDHLLSITESIIFALT